MVNIDVGLLLQTRSCGVVGPSMRPIAIGAMVEQLGGQPRPIGKVYIWPARYNGAVPIRQRYARTHNRNWILSGTFSCSVVHGEVGLCAPTSLRRTRDERSVSFVVLRITPVNYYAGRVHSGKRNVSVWCLSVCLSRSSSDAWVLRRRGQRAFRPLSSRADPLVKSQTIE